MSIVSDCLLEIHFIYENAAVRKSRKAFNLQYKIKLIENPVGMYEIMNQLWNGRRLIGAENTYIKGKKTIEK